MTFAVVANTMSAMDITVADIVRYPVKGLTGERLDRADLTVDQGLSGDRLFALALPGTRYDPANPQWFAKTGFLMLMRNPRLAALETRYDAGDGVLTIRRDGRDVVKGKLDSPIGRALIEDFFDAFLRGEIAGKPKLVKAGRGQMFSDHRDPVLSIVNLASVRDLERVIGEPVDPQRFRANLYLDGAAPWRELGWVGATLAIGGARLQVTEPIDRCAATNVRPGRGVRDMNIPQALRRGYGHVACGIYARVTDSGALAIGDRVTAAQREPDSV